MNFMKVHVFLLKGWFSSLNTLCELVSNRKSSSPSSSARESVASTSCYPRFKNIKWFWQDKHDSRELSNKFYNSPMTGKFFFLWQAALLEKLWLHLKLLHFRLIFIPLLITPKPFTNNIFVDIWSILGPAKIHSVDQLEVDICWTCFYPLSCTFTLWQKICKSEQMTDIRIFIFDKRVN